MWRLLVFVAVVVLVNSEDQGQRLPLLRSVVEPRIGLNAVRIHQLEKRLEKLKEEIKESEHTRTVDDIVHEIDARLYHVEDRMCPDDEFQCLGNAQKCISTLLVCDGHKDCDDGSDENEHEYCDVTPIKPGRVYSGHTHWHSCIYRMPHASTLTIKADIKLKSFGARRLVKADYHNILHVHDKTVEMDFPVKGYFNLAKRNLILFDEDEHADRIAAICHFHQTDHANCTFLQEASLNVCGHSYLSLQ